MSDKMVLLRMKHSKHSEPFEAAHAKRLLAYPNPQWEEVAEKDDKAATGEKKATSAAALPAVDTTGQPTSI